MDPKGGKLWSRGLGWRQATILPPEAATHFELSEPTDPVNTCVVVVSHHCDLVIEDLEKEPDAEVIVGRLIDGINGNYAWGKAPRTLHLTVIKDEQPVTLELVATRKLALPKSELGKFEPDPRFRFDGRMLALLRSWLGHRYNRASFPDAFVSRLQETRAKERLARVLEKHGEMISFVLFDLDGGDHRERADGDPYRLGIVLTYPPGADPEESQAAADIAAEAVEAALSACCADLQRISFAGCFAISEDDLPVSRMRALTEWKLEYLTFRAGTD